MVNDRQIPGAPGVNGARALHTQTMSSRLSINGQAIEVKSRETVLQAALRAGLPFPNSCRVGGCGTCRCQVKSGTVQELTETAYLLSADELAQRTVLACQSVPQGEVAIEVDLSRASLRGIAGRVIAQTKLTHDLTSLTVQLGAPLDYRAGQFANVSIEGLPGVVRSYSFATAPRGDGQVTFFIRRVDGGAFSTLVNEHDVVGRSVRVDGPVGTFWLRPGDAPLVFVAGGSGLAPILSVLEDAAHRGVTRDAVLIFGAREERDFYAAAELEAIARSWKGSFRVERVRGPVTETLAKELTPKAHVYLCGPPGLIDSSISLARSHGVRADDIHFDRFTTQADAAVPARVWDYLKFFAFHGLGLISILSLLAGGAYTTAGLLGVVLLYVFGDAVGGDDVSTPHYASPKILTFQLWLALPLILAIVFSSVWSVSSGDPFGFGAWLSALTGVDLLAARAATTFGHHVSGWVLTGLMIGMVGTITAHELTHRTWDRVSMFVGRWLLAFSFDTIFSIEHVYGHHRYVSTIDDPATAPRGRNVYAHIVASTWKGNVSAWHIEVERLKKKGLGVFSWKNAFLRGHLMSVALVVIAFALGGATAALFFVASALWGKALLEIVNYMEHYGIVRNPATPVQPRHSWNTNRRVSSWTMFNLSRHSHHHAQGEVPYHELKPYPDAPMMINGYLTTIIVALIPPLWHALMKPKVLAWDRDFATDEERALAALANERAGWGDRDGGRRLTLQKQ